MTWSMKRAGNPMPKDWPKIKAQVLERDGYRCRIRGPRCLGRANQVDHVIPRWKIERQRLPIDFDDERNLQSTCGPCHRSKTGKDANSMRGTRLRPPEKHPGLL
jgi:5-methylcytosine-specific restriction protein A